MGSLAKQGSTGKGVISGLASFFLPGLGQAINGQTDKGIGMGVVYAGSWLALSLGIPILSPIAGVAAIGTAVYSVADAYLTGKGK